MRTFLRDSLVILALALVIFILFQITLQSSVVVGSSMEPNLHQGQRILVSKVVYKLHEPERGDIIVFPNPINPNVEYIKRIIGLPGETVEIRDGMVYIHKEDGTVLTLDERDYIVNPASNSFYGNTIPPDNYFVLGDNRNNSSDSRGGWTVPGQDIVGKAWLSIWPPGQWGLAPNHSLPE